MHRIAAFAAMLLATLANAQLVERQVEYTLRGTTFRGFAVWDDMLVSRQDPAPGILVVHEWWGLNDYAKDRARMLARLGYVAFACDMYGLDESGEPRLTTEVPQASQWARSVYEDRSIMRERARAGLRQLATLEVVDDTRLAAIGYCFGGTTVLELARSGADVDVVVSFHGGLGTPNPEDARNIRGTVVVCHGAVDPFVTEAELEGFMAEMNDAGVDYVFHAYSGAVHSFTSKAADTYAEQGLEGVGYNESADRRSWQHMLSAFEEAFGAHRDMHHTDHRDR